MKKLFTYLITITLCLSSLLYAVDDWNYVTVAGAGETNLCLSANGKKALVRAISIATVNANHIYLFEGSNASPVKISEDIYLPANSILVLKNRRWEGNTDTQLKIWFQNAPGDATHKIGYIFDLITE